MANYQDMLSSLERKPDRKLNDHVVLIDSMNMFIRSMAMVSTMNPQGHHTGGLLGYLRSLGFLQREFDPTRMICVFDGNGSTINRKAINPEYKGTRNIKRITNWEIFDDKDDEYASMTMQMGRLVEYLQCLPVGIITIDKVEADDVISFLAQSFSRAGKKVTIISTDKDFLQIVDSNIQVYSPIKKKMYGESEVFEEVGMIPENYLIMKALLGDSSDNLSGVKGLGPKTLLKEFPQLKNDRSITLDSIYTMCEDKLQTKKIFAQIIYDFDKVKTNYKLMNLLQPRLSDEEIFTILNKIRKPISHLQIGTFENMLAHDQIDGLNKNIESWLDRFRPLMTYQK